MILLKLSFFPNIASRGGGLVQSLPLKLSQVQFLMRKKKKKEKGMVLKALNVNQNPEPVQV